MITKLANLILWTAVILLVVLHFREVSALAAGYLQALGEFLAGLGQNP